MSSRLAGEFALLAAAGLLGRGLWEGSDFSTAIELALWGGVAGWLAGYAAAEVLKRLARERVALTTAAHETRNRENEAAGGTSPDTPATN